MHYDTVQLANTQIAAVAGRAVTSTLCISLQVELCHVCVTRMPTLWTRRHIQPWRQLLSF